MAGRVQVSESTHWRLQRAFDLETRRTVRLKDDVQAVAYLLVGRKTKAS